MTAFDRVQIASLIFLAGCWSSNYRARAILADDTILTMTVQGMFGFHSDWHRRLALGSPNGKMEIELFDDTGWWRGSNLYLHKSGVYVLHEGQIGCIAFTINPPTFVPQGDISCEKNKDDGSGNILQLEVPSTEAAISHFYADFIFLGRFSEGLRPERGIKFIGADEAQEVELPDIL